MLFVLQEVVAILADDALPFAVRNVPLDLPEIQGEPEDVARVKCAEAARQVSQI